MAVCDALAGVLAIRAVMSQMDVVRFLLEHASRGALGPMAARSLEDLGLVLDPATLQPRCARPDGARRHALRAHALLVLTHRAWPQPRHDLGSGVECVDGATPALDAFGVMLARGVSALGVLDAEGRLAANLSASDLRAVLPDRFGVLAQPVHRFLELQCAGGTSGARRARGAVAVRGDATLEEAMRAIVQLQLHHVFVVDERGAPQALVSTTDVLRLLVPAAGA